MGELVKAVLYGSLGSILAAIIIWLFLRSKKTLALLGSVYQLAVRLNEAGITKFQISRDQYTERLPTYLATANHSICIVSISLKLTGEEGNLVELFRSRLASNPNFRISISLLAPKSNAAMIAASSLNITHEVLGKEISAMLKQLKDLKDSLQNHEKSRFQVLVHDSLPMGSVLLLDASPDQGRIQVETKLYRSPRIESFGFEVRGPSTFYRRNYLSWMKVLDESHEVTSKDLIP